MWRDCTRCAQRYLSASGLTSSCPECRKLKKPRLSLGLSSRKRVRAPAAGSPLPATTAPGHGPPTTASTSIPAPAPTVEQPLPCVPSVAPPAPSADEHVVCDTACDAGQADRKEGCAQIYEFSDWEDSEDDCLHGGDAGRGLRHCNNREQDEQEEHDEQQPDCDDEDEDEDEDDDDDEGERCLLYTSPSPRD